MDGAFACIADNVAQELLKRADPRENIWINLANGTAGQMLLFAELASANINSKVYRRVVEESLEKITSSLTDAIDPGLFDGLAGVCWSIKYVSDLLGFDEYSKSDSYDEIYDYFGSFLSDSNVEYEYDLISGLAGIGLWALTIADKDQKEKLVSLILSQLKRSAEQNKDGITWATPLARPPRMRNPSVKNEIEYNLGVAHGVPGVIGFLSECVLSNVMSKDAERLLKGSVVWLLTKRKKDALSRFSDVVDGKASRLAWCYGDAGIAAVLLKAARALRSDSTLHEALDVVHHSANRPLETTFVSDTGVCHGAAGLALIFNQISTNHSSAEIEMASSFWTAQVLAMRNNDIGICGFFARTVNLERNKDASWLTGAAGAALTLLSLETKNFNWSYPFLAGP